MKELSNVDNNRKVTFTVFTPTYNRAHTLPRVYQSLCNQTMSDLEWLIIDDGSSDNSLDLIKTWINEDKFPIRYFYQKNSGKHIAFNRAVTLANGELFLPVDSDDAFVDSALERLLYHWREIPDNKRYEYTGVACLCMYADGKIVGDKYPYKSIDSTALENRYKLKIKGDKWGFHRVNVLKEFPFPEPRGAKMTHIPEDMVWLKIARKYKMRCINEALLVYHMDSGNQVTRSDLTHKLAVRRYYAELLERDIDYLPYAPLFFMKKALLFIRYSTLAGDSIVVQWRTFRKISPRMVWLFMLLPGLLVAFCDSGKSHPKGKKA